MSRICSRLRSALHLARPRPSSPTDDEIRRDGLVGRATVLEARPTGRRHGERRELAVRLDVLIPTRRRFEVTIRAWLTEADAAKVVAGRPISVAADRAEPGHVVLVLTDDAVNPVAVASLGPFAGGPGGPKPTGVGGPGGPTPDEAGGPDQSGSQSDA